jgi:hypothetical protein
MTVAPRLVRVSIDVRRRLAGIYEDTNQLFLLSHFALEILLQADPQLTDISDERMGQVLRHVITLNPEVAATPPPGRLRDRA